MTKQIYVNIAGKNIVSTDGCVVGSVRKDRGVTIFEAPVGVWFGDISSKSDSHLYYSESLNIGGATHRHYSDAVDRVLFNLEMALRASVKGA